MLPYYRNIGKSWRTKDGLSPTRPTRTPTRSWVGREGIEPPTTGFFSPFRGRSSLSHPVRRRQERARRRSPLTWASPADRRHPGTGVSERVGSPASSSTRPPHGQPTDLDHVTVETEPAPQLPDDAAEHRQGLLGRRSTVCSMEAALQAPKKRLVAATTRPRSSRSSSPRRRPSDTTGLPWTYTCRIARSAIE
jgi:hypothetical protein